MPDWIGDQMAGVGPEATRDFGRMRTKSGHLPRRGERTKSTPELNFLRLSGQAAIRRKAVFLARHASDAASGEA